MFLHLSTCNQEPTQPAIPILLAVGAVHQHLIQNGLRMSASIVADTAQCFSTHHFACLIGYGARLFLSSFLASFFKKNVMSSMFIFGYISLKNESVILLVAEFVYWLHSLDSTVFAFYLFPLCDILYCN